LSARKEIKKFICGSCSGEFFTQTPGKRQCRPCARKENSLLRVRVTERGKNRHGKWGLSTGSVGAVSELVACVDLMKKGYDVFRAVSPSCPCDLIIRKGGLTFRVEVRTAQKLLNGKFSYPCTKKDEGRSDIFALVCGDAVMYVPELLLEESV